LFRLRSLALGKTLLIGPFSPHQFRRAPLGFGQDRSSF
jgi:hypothetical protein